MALVAVSGNGNKAVTRLGVCLAALIAAAGIGAASGTPALAKNTITVNVVQVFRSIDPAKMSDYADYMAAFNFYDPLVTVAEGGKLEPALAENWKVSDDGKEFTFKIRDDAKFTDGSPVEASDVVYSVERLLKINQGPASLFEGVLGDGSVKAVDNKTVTFTLKKTFSPFLSMVPSIMILNANVVKENAGNDDGQTYLSTHVAGAGAYSLKSWERGARMIMERNQNYYKGFRENPIDEVRFVITNDESTVRSLAASGELTLSSAYQAPETYEALKAMGRFDIKKFNTATGFYLKLNTKVAPTDDIHIRKAIALATDYKTIREVITTGGVLSGPLPEAFGKFHADDIPAPEYDLQAAKAEVEKSKYAGSSIPITLGYVSGTKVAEELTLLMQSNLEQIGFKVTQEGNPWNRVTDLATKVDTTPAVNQVYFGPTYPSPDSMFYTQYHSKAAGTWASMEWLQNPEIDKLIDQARATSDENRQIEIYKELQHKIVDLQPDVFVLTMTAQLAIDKCLDGYKYVPMQSVSYSFSRYSWTCKQK